MRRTARRSGRLAAAVLVALGGWLATASPAQAHNTLRSSAPADQAVVDTVPTEIVLTLDDPAIALGTAIVVTGPAGGVGDGPASLIDNTVRQPIRGDAPAGDYTVQWRVTSADGHPISGTFRFAARAGGATSASSPSQTDPRSAPATGVPSWIWPVVAAALLLSALTSAAATRRRHKR